MRGHGRIVEGVGEGTPGKAKPQNRKLILIVQVGVAGATKPPGEMYRLFSTSANAGMQASEAWA